MSMSSSEANAKKNAKKKAKKKVSEETNAEARALEQAIKDYNPNAEVIADGWVEVKDAKKAKSKERVLRKKAAAEAKAAEATAETDNAAVLAPPPEDSSPKALKKKKRQPEESKAAKKKKGPEHPAKKKKSKAPDFKRPASEPELVVLVKSIIDAHPQRFLNVATIGDRVTALTKSPWTKTFKPQFGTLKDFITNHPNDFHFEPTLDRTYVKQEWDELEAAKARQQAEASAKKAAKNRRADASSSSEHKSKVKKAAAANGVKGDVSPSSFLLKTIAILGLAGALVFLTALAVNGFDVNVVLNKARALVG